MELSTPKTEGKLHHARSAWCISFPSVFGVDTSISPKNITTIPYHFISTLLNANFDFDVSVANDVAIDVAKCALPGKVMQWSPCPEVRTLTNENGRYIIKLNDKYLYTANKNVKLARAKKTFLVGTRCPYSTTLYLKVNAKSTR